LRFSFGKFTKKQDIDKALSLIKIIKLWEHF
jgi:cysteine sulfinate desulfinase/cysteine desulfurase-like protein